MFEYVALTNLVASISLAQPTPASLCISSDSAAQSRREIFDHAGNRCHVRRTMDPQEFEATTRLKGSLRVFHFKKLIKDITLTL